jgi:hypothetical protein
MELRILLPKRHATSLSGSRLAPLRLKGCHFGPNEGQGPVQSVQPRFMLSITASGPEFRLGAAAQAATTSSTIPCDRCCVGLHPGHGRRGSAAWDQMPHATGRHSVRMSIARAWAARGAAAAFNYYAVVVAAVRAGRCQRLRAMSGAHRLKSGSTKQQGGDVKSHEGGASCLLGLIECQCPLGEGQQLAGDGHSLNDAP